MPNHRRCRILEVTDCIMVDPAGRCQLPLMQHDVMTRRVSCGRGWAFPVTRMMGLENRGRTTVLSLGLPSNPLNPYNLREALKIPDVMGQQTRNAVGQHGGHDIGIVDLLAADLEVPQ